MDKPNDVYTLLYSYFLVSLKHSIGHRHQNCTTEAKGRLLHRTQLLAENIDATTSNLAAASMQQEIIM